MPLKTINLSESRLRSLDPRNMLGMTLELPAQIQTGLDLGRAFSPCLLRTTADHHPGMEFPVSPPARGGARGGSESSEANALIHPLKKIRRLDWIGLGGSAVAGDLLRGLGCEPPALPLTITVQRYPRPSATRRLFCSYSGNTVETLHALTSSPRDQVYFALSSGGRLQELAADAAVPHLQIPAGYPPRAAAGFTLGALLGIFEQVYAFDTAEAAAACRLLDADAGTYRKLDAASNLALALAVKFVDRTPVIWTTDGLAMPPLALRFRAQLAENSKVWSHAAELPEMAHNEVEALGFLGQLLPPPLVLFLGSWQLEKHLPDPRPGLQSLLDSLSISHLPLDPAVCWPDTPGRMTAVLRTLLLLDAVSVYLGILRAVDPYEIPVISDLKQRIAVT